MQIKNKELLRTIKYTLFMISAGVIQFVSSTVIKLILDAVVAESKIFFITEFILSTFIADTVGLFLSIIWNFTFNRKYTFKSANNVPIAMTLALLFYVPFYPFQIWYVDMVEVQANIGIWGYLIGLVTCMIINGVLEFLWQRFVIYRKSIDTNVQETSKQSLPNADSDGVDVSADVVATQATTNSQADDNAEKSVTIETTETNKTKVPKSGKTHKNDTSSAKSAQHNDKNSD